MLVNRSLPPVPPSTAELSCVVVVSLFSVRDVDLDGAVACPAGSRGRLLIIEFQNIGGADVGR